MPCRIIKAKLRRKQGKFYWVYACPYCGINHWMYAGCYTEDPHEKLGYIRTRCGHEVEIVEESKK